MNNYETVFSLSRRFLSEAQVQEVADKFQGVITENGGQLVNVEKWGAQKLAYPIQNKTTGFYPRGVHGRGFSDQHVGDPVSPRRTCDPLF